MHIRHLAPRQRLAVNLALACMATLPTLSWAVLPDEVYGDNFDGFDLAACDDALTVDSSAAADYAKAMDICQVTTEGSHAPGLISAALLLADGGGVPSTASRRIRTSYGAITPQHGSALALLSTGTAAGSGDAGYTAPQLGYQAATQSAMPSDYLMAHGGTLPKLPACPAPAGTNAIDPVMLKLRIRAPNNARSFSFNAQFLTSDFPEYACFGYSDYFVALLDSPFGADLNPADKNVASVISTGGFPFNVDLAVFDDGSFSQCVNGVVGCGPGAGGTYNISHCTGTDQLVGTGMDPLDNSGACSMGQQVGGGTGWMVVRGNVVPGDTIELRLAIWDVGDGLYDSDVVLDNFRWSYQAVTAGAAPLMP